jgi:hypothetical protein
MRALLNFATLLLRCTLAFFRSRNEQATVELALRQQLATCAQKQSKPRLTSLDRAFWVALSRFWPGWKAALVIVEPDTVIRWHRKGFCLYWRAISKRGPGRPPTSEEVQGLIRRLASENGWRARKIQAELEKLGGSGTGRATVPRAGSMLGVPKLRAGGDSCSRCCDTSQVLSLLRSLTWRRR